MIPWILQHIHEMGTVIPSLYNDVSLNDGDATLQTSRWVIVL